LDVISAACEGREQVVNARLGTQILEAFVAQLARCKRILSWHPSLARAMRSVARRNAFDKIDLHEEMLADTVRLDAYQAAIERHVTAQDCVVDIGTGTGVLAFFAAAKTRRKVYAIDHSRTMLNYARTAAEANGIDNLIFMESNSHGFRPAEPVDVIVQEQMGIALFDEGMLETILDARDRYLKPGGRILPAKFEFYLEPVQLVAQERIPMLGEQQTHELTFPPAQTVPERTYYFREIYPRDVEFLLCDPDPAFAFDLATLTPGEIPKGFSLRKRIERGGQVDGICIYFTAAFDDDIRFSTGPQAAKTHWPMLLYRTPARPYRAGEIFKMQVEAPHLSEYLDWSWTIGRRECAG
jgi:protein arginine N-methyltransferase 1